MSFIGRPAEFATDILSGRAVAVIDDAVVPLRRLAGSGLAALRARERASRLGYDPVRHRFVQLDRPVGARWERWTLTGRQIAASKRAHRMLLFLPYGVWTQADGRRVWFNRYYECLIARDADGTVSIPDPAERVRWVDQRWLYNDGNPPGSDAATLARCEAVLSELGGRW
jgi:hypothetical protein